jgi:TolA-binding protein
MISEIVPDDINCKFYSGMCYYFKKDFKSAIRNFNECISHSNNTFLNEAQFYKALSLNESGNKEEAKTLLKQIAAEGGFYSQKAMLLLN